MSKTPGPSAEMLAHIKQNYRYDPQTGEILKVCGWVGTHGYRRIGFSLGPRGAAEFYGAPAHRVCWFLQTGEWPTDIQIDHVNRERDDNRWANLRAATPQQNATNRRSWGRVRSRGVTMITRAGKELYRASIGTWPNRVFLGEFDCEEDAAAAYAVAARERYGEFAVTE